MFVADLLTALESAHPADSVRILIRREGVGGQNAAIKIEDAMVVAAEPRTVLLKPAIELCERDQERLTISAARLQELQLATREAMTDRQAADQVMRTAYGMLVAGQAAVAQKYLHDNLPENRSIAHAVEGASGMAANGPAQRQPKSSAS